MSSVEEKKLENQASKPRFQKLPISAEMVHHDDHDWDDDLNVYFSEGDFQRFVGDIKCKDYSISRKYIDAEMPSLRILLTTVKPLQVEAWAQICIVHGFGEHSGRYFGVK